VRNQPAAVGTIPAAGIAGIVRLIGAGTITATIAKQVYALLEADPSADPGVLVEEHGLGSIGDTGELERMVDEVVAQNPQFVEQFQAGKEGVINALVGQVMKQTRGRADARQVQQLLRDRIAR
jgi:aspartyl-tRNA(Asn)/glutamyl-tRNA(Gln) amidotransferase subunit B